MEYSIKVNPLQERDQELLKMAPISSHFPVKFKKGTTYTMLQVCCAECGQELKNEDVHGEVRPVLPNMTQVEARAYCRPCKLITPINYRLYAEGYFTGIKDGKWRTFHMKKIPFWKKVFRFLF